MKMRQLKGMKKALLAVAVVLVSFGVAYAGGDSPQTGFKITPVLQVVTQTTVGMVWETHNASAGTIRIATNSSMSGARVLTTSSAKIGRVRVTGLAADTRYYYRVTADGATSATRSFVTALQVGSRQPFRFVVYGDSRTAPWYEDIIAKYGDNDDHLPVCQSMMSYAPDFLVHVGDFVYSGTNMDDIYNFFDVEREMLASNPMLPTYGNHEFDGGNATSNTYMDSYLIPAVGATFSYYAYNYGNVHILVVNTGTIVFAGDNADHLKPGSPQYAFIQADLQAAAANPNIDHIFVSLHAAPYSAANFGDNQNLINYLEPLFRQYRVKAVFMGHEHDYQHMVHDGIHYILSGGAGSSMMDYPWKGDQNDTHANLIKYAEVLNYVIVDVDGPTINFQARQVQGQGNSSSSLLEAWGL
jgi:predicted phosphodiesterase